MNIDSYYINIGNATDVGKVREHNEDYMAHFDTPIGYCIVVCDGMGGHTAGDMASQNAVAAIKKFLQDKKNTSGDIYKTLQNAIEFANYHLRELVQQNPALKGMGTTCVIALIHDGKMYVAHAGDSRLYLLRDKGIKQISKDHSVVQDLIERGTLTEEEAERSEKKNQITKALGIFEKVNPTVTLEPVALIHNDKILLCSDGLTGHVSNQSINETILKNEDVQDAALELIEKANNGGGTDNITVQLIHYTGKSSANVRRRKPVRKYAAVASLVILLVGAGILASLKMTSKKETPAEKVEIKKVVLPKSKIDSTPLYHIVVKSDKLLKIARKNKTTKDKLSKWNHLKSDSLRLGQKLIVGFQSADTSKKYSK